MVALMSGGTCVGGRNDRGTYDGGTKVAPPYIIQVIQYKLLYTSYKIQVILYQSYTTVLFTMDKDLG